MRIKIYAKRFLRRWKESLGWILTAWGAAWLVIESLSFLFVGFKTLIDEHNLITFAIMLLLALAVLICRMPLRKTSFLIPTTNTTVEILFGDFFETKGHWGIPVSEFFESQLGDLVAPHSVHGQLIQRFFESDSRRFEAKVDLALAGVSSREKRRENGRNRSYPIGTVAVIDIGERKSFLLALTKSDLQSARTTADFSMMWDALQKLWDSVRHHSNGHPINVPLIGGGRADVGLEPAQLLRIIILSLLVATRGGQVTGTVRIVLHEDIFDRIDLRSVCEEWSKA